LNTVPLQCGDITAGVVDDDTAARMRAARR
jgi:hypothetical protein